MTHDMDWWQRGVVYQVYPRSFKDTNGDGVGDLAGVIEQLDYLVDLGIDAIWLSPFYPSPMADFGYDVADYCDVDPMFGDLATFDALVAGAHQRGLRIIIDWVPNHTSDRHPWFIESRSSCENPKRDWYIWRDAKSDGSLPNNWGSFFGGPAWTYDAATGQYYMHQFVPEQPELNWRNPDVRTAMYDTLRFWMRRGVDGFRMDVIGLIIKDKDLRDNPLNPDAPASLPENDIHGRLSPKYNMDQDEVHDVIREIRAVLDEFDSRCGIGELWGSLDRWVRYYGENGDELQMPFNFRLMDGMSWDAEMMRSSVDAMEAALPSFAWPNYVLGNHDRIRLSTRFGGEAQARSAAMMLLTLRGTPTIYYGEEIGMENVPIAADQMKDPQGINLGVERTRDVCRTPMQWDTSANAGFSVAGASLWLPLADDWQDRNVATQSADPHSIFNLYRTLLSLRRARTALYGGRYQAIDSLPSGIYAYKRWSEDDSFIVVLNFTDKPVELAVPLGGAYGRVVLSTHMDRDERVTLAHLALRANEGVVIQIA